ncbi:MAG: peptidoglycan-binding protein LysM [Leptospiraceae bacterium]|nr:peptidoglycan-binding protein LysM [Leptospiraceae bacterium]
MGLFDFVEDIGTKLFGDEDDNAALKIKEYIMADDLAIEDLEVEYADGVVTLSGSCDSAATREKAILLAGNLQGVTEVVADDLQPSETTDSDYYIIKKGDTLSKIAGEYYGDVMKYPVIFEANREVIKNADLIYPGQKIRIPRNP